MTCPSLETIQRKLAQPFAAADLEWRLNSCGKSGDRVWAQCLCYVTSRAIMDRLDAVVGTANWSVKHRFEPVRSGEGEISACITSLAIRFGDVWVTKEDGCDPSDIEPVKGAISGGVKRAAVHWGIGRHLYLLEENFADVSMEKREGYFKAFNQKLKGGGQETFYWRPPALPGWYLDLLKQTPAPRQQIEKAKSAILLKGGPDLLASFEGTIGCPLDEWTIEHLRIVKDQWPKG